jgi:predicted nucleotidyltransferase component of viral defense system
MTGRTVKNLPASVRQRLLDLSRERGEDFQFILTRFAAERFLYRLSQSPHAERFILKGATLFLPWGGEVYRPTRDVDLLGYGDTSEERVGNLIGEICQQTVEPDGLEFDAETVHVEQIRVEGPYSGLRVKLMATLAGARAPLQIDIGFGDAVTPEATVVEYPTLLNHPAPRIRSYPPETVVAEKLHTIVVRGMGNSRMRDYYDLRMMARQFSFEGSVVVEAIRATFARRNTEIPGAIPIGLDEEFSADSAKATQWNAFLRKSGFESDPPQLTEVLDEVRSFLLAPFHAATGGEPFEQVWSPGGPWSQNS